MLWHEDFAAAFLPPILGIMWVSHLALHWKCTSHCQVHMNELLFLGTARGKKNTLNKLLNFFCWTPLQVAGVNAFTKLLQTANAVPAMLVLQSNSNRESRNLGSPIRSPILVREPSPLQCLPFRIPILYFSKDSVHCEVIYDTRYYNCLAAPKQVKIATII